MHHLLALYSLGASPDEVQTSYEINERYQKKMIVHSAAEAEKLNDPENFKRCLGNHKNYNDFLKFFTKELATKSIPQAVNEFVFDGSERADDMLARMFGGFLHPIIHLGYAIEFDQPLLAAEALAQCAIHDTEVELVCGPAEKLARAASRKSDVTIVSLQQKLAADPVTSTAVEWEDAPNKFTAGLVPRAGDRVAEIISEYTVEPEDLGRKTAEMINAGVYIGAAAQMPGKVEMIDFFLMHCINLSYFFTVFNAQPWISKFNKCRLLEWKTRLDLAIYAACRTPAAYPERISKYQPKQPGNWDSIYERARSYRDDGHAIKLIRALKNAEEVSRPYAGQPGFPLAPQDCLTVAHLVMDSVERMDSPDYKIPPSLQYFKGMDEEVVRITVRWTRWSGLEEAWDEVPNSDHARL